jgi:hypothetical protein
LPGFAFLYELFKLAGFQPSLRAVAHVEDPNGASVLGPGLEREEDLVDVRVLPEKQYPDFCADILRLRGESTAGRHLLQGVDSIEGPWGNLNVKAWLLPPAHG